MADALLLSQVKIFDPDGPHHGQRVDVLFVDDELRVNPTSKPAEVDRVDASRLSLSRGWADLGAVVTEPGLEQRETIRSFQQAALAGGYAHVLVQPDTVPKIDTASEVLAFQQRASGHAVELRVIASLQQADKKLRLSELGELADAGVRFVSLGADEPFLDPRMLQLALEYSAQLGLTVVTSPTYASPGDSGQLHEGVVSTRLGLPGMASVTESVSVHETLSLSEYTGGRVHFNALSARAAVQLLEAQDSAHVSFGVPALNLLLTDEALLSYDVNLKVLPPLRLDADRDALRETLRTGAAQALVSQHRPHVLEDKRVEFPYASFGAATIEHVYGIAQTALSDSDTVVDYLSGHNRRLLGLACRPIASGAADTYTLYAPDETYEPASVRKHTLGYNVPLPDRPLTGRAVGVVRDNTLHKA